MDAIGGSGRRVQMCFTVIRDYVSALFLRTPMAKTSTIEYPTRGMMNGNTILEASAIMPMRRNPQPPIGVIMRSDEALFVRSARPRVIALE